VGPGEIIIEILYQKAYVGTSSQSSSSQLCHCPSEDSKVHSPLRMMNTFTVISVDTGCKETLRCGWTLHQVGNPSRGRRTKQTLCPLGTIWWELTPKGISGGQKKGSVKKQECHFTQCAAGGKGGVRAGLALRHSVYWITPQKNPQQAGLTTVTSAFGTGTRL